MIETISETQYEEDMKFFLEELYFDKRKLEQTLSLLKAKKDLPRLKVLALSYHQGIRTKACEVIIALGEYVWVEKAMAEVPADRPGRDTVYLVDGVRKISRLIEKVKLDRAGISLKAKITNKTELMTHLKFLRTNKQDIEILFDCIDKSLPVAESNPLYWELFKMWQKRADSQLPWKILSQEVLDFCFRETYKLILKTKPEYVICSGSEHLGRWWGRFPSFTAGFTQASYYHKDKVARILSVCKDLISSQLFDSTYGPVYVDDWFLSCLANVSRGHKAVDDAIIRVKANEEYKSRPLLNEKYKA